MDTSRKDAREWWHALRFSTLPFLLKRSLNRHLATRAQNVEPHHVTAWVYTQ